MDFANNHNLNQASHTDINKNLPPSTDNNTKLLQAIAMKKDSALSGYELNSTT